MRCLSVRSVPARHVAPEPLKGLLKGLQGVRTQPYTPKSSLNPKVWGVGFRLH